MTTIRTIDFLYLDRTDCSRCASTEGNLDEALRRLEPTLAARGVTLEVNRIHVDSLAQAERLGFQSSPTIRVDGVDIAPVSESPCESDACSCADGPIDCRVWHWQGREFHAAPVEMIEHAVLHPGLRLRPSGEPAGVPDNLRRFFQDQPAGAAGCCAPAERETCCEPKAKQECCGDGAGCGCQ